MTSKATFSDAYHSVFDCHPETVSPKDLFLKFIKTANDFSPEA